MGINRRFVVVSTVALMVANVAHAITTYSPPIRSSDGNNFACVGENVGFPPAQVTAQMHDSDGNVVDSGTLSIPNEYALRIAGNQTAVLGGYCSFTFDGDAAAVRGFVTLQDAGGSDTRLIYVARGFANGGPPLQRVLSTPPLRSDQGNNLGCVAQNLSAAPVQVAAQIHDGLGGIVSAVETLAVAPGAVKTIASINTQVFGAFCVFSFLAPADQVRCFATREDAGGSDTRLLVEATPAFTAAVVSGCCGDCNGDGLVTVDEIVTGVNWALNGCPTQ